MREKTTVELPALPFGRSYFRWCKIANLRFGPKEESIRKTQEKRAAAFKKEQERFRDATRTHLDAEFRYLPTDRGYETARREFERARCFTPWKASCEPTFAAWIMTPPLGNSKRK